MSRCFRTSMVRSDKGFTLTELIVVVSIIAIIAGLSAPTMVEFRRNLQCRQAAMSIVSMLRQARSQAIATNQEQKVQFGSQNRWAIQTGNRPYGSDTWTPNPIPDNLWTKAPNLVSVTPAQDIQYVPNGTVSVPGGTISITDSTGVLRFTINVEATGRVNVTKAY